MQAGKMRHRITLQEPVKEQNPTTGAVINTWRDVATLWAEVAALSAREFIAAQASQGEVTTRITIRYREGVTRKHRILFRGRIYNIEGVLPDPRSGREYLTLPCSEGANDG
ncbi:phage head closure protein [Escherichia coli]|nr:phage head closure protein [Escherichia coli]